MKLCRCRKHKYAATDEMRRWLFLHIPCCRRERLTVVCGCVIIFITGRGENRVPMPLNFRRTKLDALIEEGTLNPAPEKVSDPKFKEGDFFDPRDVVQVKYELLRRVLVEKVSITDAAQEYGISRPTYYQAKASFDQAGIAGLVPKKRGPHGPHKMRGEVMEFIERRLVPGEPIRAREMSALVQRELGLYVHPRSIERAVKEKKMSRRK